MWGLLGGKWKLLTHPQAHCDLIEPPAVAASGKVITAEISGLHEISIDAIVHSSDSQTLPH